MPAELGLEASGTELTNLIEEAASERARDVALLDVKDRRRQLQPFSHQPQALPHLELLALLRIRGRAVRLRREVWPERCGVLRVEIESVDRLIDEPEPIGELLGLGSE